MNDREKVLADLFIRTPRMEDYCGFIQSRQATKEDLLRALHFLHSTVESGWKRIYKEHGFDVNKGPEQIPGYDEEEHNLVFDYAYCAALWVMSETLNYLFADFGGLGAIPQISGTPKAEDNRLF